MREGSPEGLEPSLLIACRCDSHPDNHKEKDTAHHQPTDETAVASGLRDLLNVAARRLLNHVGERGQLLITIEDAVLLSRAATLS